jgi:alkylation response protein AidB-like acyl-CoA dehydrogenase
MQSRGFNSERAIREFQAIDFMLADMAVDIMAAKSTLYRVAWGDRRGHRPQERPRARERRQALSSEMAGRVLDRGAAGARRSRLHARESRRAAVSRRSRRSDLGRPRPRFSA